MNNIFANLFIFEMANNHQGSVDHGKKIIDAMGAIAKERNIHAAVKFQFRDLDTFIHPEYQGREDVKHIGRFLGTRLTNEQFGEMVTHTKKAGMLAIATPFDEVSVQTCTDLDIDVLKIASCSAHDWPLLEEVANAGKPVVVSTGGLSLAEIDKVVHFFQHRQVNFALMHCVGVYPTPNELMHMRMVERLRRRYSGVQVGYSGHEAPDNVEVGIVAVSMGAELLERHVGVATDDIQLNAYSMDPEQTDAWVQAVQRTQSIMGEAAKSVTDGESSSLRSLMRGVYAKKPIAKGSTITKDDVYFAMPLQDGQLTSGEFGSYRASFVASHDYQPDQPVAEVVQPDAAHMAREYIHEGRGMLAEANIPLTDDSELELSHHYGLDKFRETGAMIVNIMNREYCKKYIVVLPGQKHPAHRHEKKEETFELLWGDLTVKLDDAEITMQPGDRLLVKRNTWHSFASKHGAIFEEISTTHFRDDSFYEDESISALDPMQRKTIIREIM